MSKKLFDPDDNSHLAHLPTIALSDSNGLLRAHGHYGNSWKKRGGCGAYFMLARKWDRLEKLVSEKGYDIFRAMDEDTRGEGIIDDIRDLRRYLLLVEAEATARGYECCSVRHRDNLEETGRATSQVLDRAAARDQKIIVGGPGTYLQGEQQTMCTNVDGETVVEGGPKDDHPGPGVKINSHSRSLGQISNRLGSEMPQRHLPSDSPGGSEA